MHHSIPATVSKQRSSRRHAHKGTVLLASAPVRLLRVSVVVILLWCLSALALGWV